MLTVCTIVQAWYVIEIHSLLQNDLLGNNSYMKNYQ